MRIRVHAPMILARDLSIRHTVASGQPLAFYSHYSNGKHGEDLRYVTQAGEISILKRSGRISFCFSGEYTEKSAKDEIVSRLGLGDDMGEIYRNIGTDQFMEDAIKSFKGLRITRNDPWEATLCFVISQFNNIKRIRGIMGRMIGEFGEDRGKYHAFPTPEAIASADLGAIRACGTGFRDRYIKSVAEEFAFSFDKKKLYGMGYGDAKAALMELDGIGDKVADCILLFGYNKLEAFPIDTWVKRIMERVYFKGRKTSIRKLHEFAAERWPGRYQGYAQQYIFWHGRENIG